MKYYKMYKEHGAKAFEVSKEEARSTLEGWWKQDVLDRVFEKELVFRLYTPRSEVWTETDEHEVPIAGLYGICDE